MKIAIVIPAHNEEKNIAAVLDSIPSLVFGHEVVKIVVDDGSKDRTSLIAKSREGTKLLKHKTNLGKGAAVKTGCDVACKIGAEYIVLMDGDGQHDVSEIKNLLSPVLDAKEPIITIGCRRKTKEMPMAMRLGNGTLSALISLFFGIKVKDTQSGFRVFPTSVYPLIRWGSANYAMETEMLILAAYHSIPCFEVPIATIYHDSYKGTTIIDGLRVFKTMLKWRILWSREFKSLESFSV